MLKVKNFSTVLRLTPALKDPKDPYYANKTKHMKGNQKKAAHQISI